MKPTYRGQSTIRALVSQYHVDREHVTERFPSWRIEWWIERWAENREKLVPQGYTWHLFKAKVAVEIARMARERRRVERMELATSVRYLRRRRGGQRHGL